MAKKKKPSPEKPKKKTIEPIQGMNPPNHNIPLSMCKDPADCATGSHRYPMLHLAIPDSADCGLPSRPAFVADLHDRVKAVECGWEIPPTWMDPEVFIRMCKASEEVRALALSIATKNDRATIKKLIPALAKVFEDQYLVFMLEEFDRIVPVIAEWLAASVRDRLERQEGKAKRRGQPQG